MIQMAVESTVDQVHKRSKGRTRDLKLASPQLE